MRRIAWHAGYQMWVIYSGDKLAFSLAGSPLVFHRREDAAEYISNTHPR